ncbi:ferritin-like domain-containing protein [Plectosphaerella plurivora]|uniref:Ferritin-like domain-containing protein n=1 Tax=Plectosphaerella plurivora TaxID=936078 RepID=A0A9P8V9D2_9PEZI|nr:ferritin-like domain-containing protein [Plectosphaerella plurivora]
MRASTILLSLQASLALGSPVVKKSNYDPLPGGDIDILNYALTLEYLERKFYRDGLAKYTEAQFLEAGCEADFYANLIKIKEDEETHVEFLAGALADKAIPEPSFAFPDTDARSFLALSSVLEGVGVSAYLGAAAVIVDKTYLTAAGSILTVEARHASYIRAAIGHKPFPTPFDTPLNFNQVFSLAAQFVTGFAPGTPELPFKAFPKLTVDAKSSYHGVVFTGAAADAAKSGLVKEGETVYAVFFTGLETLYAPVVKQGDDYTLAQIPSGKSMPAGQVYVVLSTASGEGTTVSDENTVAGVGILEL